MLVVTYCFSYLHLALARSPAGSLPYIELNGKLLTQSYPTLRYFARQLGKYDGKTSEEQYFADVSGFAIV